MSPMSLDTLPPIHHRMKLRPLNTNIAKRKKKKSTEHLAPILQLRQRKIVCYRKLTLGIEI